MVSPALGKHLVGGAADDGGLGVELAHRAHQRHHDLGLHPLAFGGARSALLR
jgi:hypothetical protein